jgi:hypothetical protein
MKPIAITICPHIGSMTAIHWIVLGIVIVIVLLGLWTRFAENEWVENLSTASLTMHAKWHVSGLPANAEARELVRRRASGKTGGAE